MTNISIRVIGSIVLCISLLYLPTWATILLAVIFSIFFPAPYEAVLIGYCVDILYGIPYRGFIIGHAHLLSFLTLFILSFWIRDHFQVEL